MWIWRPESEIKLTAEWVASGGAEVKTVPYLPPSFWQLQVVLHVTWLVDVSPQALPPSSLGFLYSVSKAPSAYKDTSHWG